VLELYDRIARVAESDQKAELAPPRLGELQRSFLDPSLAERELGWRAEHGLDAGLGRTWEWISRTV
jgi:UDP-glucose 4-epimerase